MVYFVTADSDGAGDVSEDGDSDGGAEEQDAEELLNEAVEGDEKQAGSEGFVDKEHESQFCLETNFMNEEDDDTESTAEHEDSRGTKGLNHWKTKSTVGLYMIQDLLYRYQKHL